MSRVEEMADKPMIVRAMDKGKFVRVNDSFKAKVGFDATDLAEKPFLDWIAPCDRTIVQAALENDERTFFARHITRNGSTLLLNIQVSEYEDDLFVLGRCTKVPTQFKPDNERPTDTTVWGTLDAIARIIEEHNTGFKCSILLVAEGRFVFGAGPSLPKEYNSAVNGYAVGPNIGSCGTAIYWNIPVIVEDIQADPLWAPLSELAKKAGLASCWSHPFVGSNGNVQGALALYYSEPCSPTIAQFNQLKANALIIGLAVERGRAEEKFKQADEASKLVRNKLQATLNALPDMLFEVDFEGRIINYHTPRYDLLAAPPDVFIGTRFADIFPIDAVEANQRAIDEAMRSGFSYGETFRLTLPQGERWFELSVASFHADAKSDQHFIMISRDITGRMQVERELRKVLNHNQTFFETVAQPAIVVSKSYEILMANDAAAVAAGKTIDELIGKKCHFIFCGTETPPADCPAAKLLLGRLAEPVQKEMSTAGGFFFVTATPVIDDSSAIEHIILFATDITKLKNIEQTLINAKHLAETVNRVKSEFLANMSHEIRTPLSGMLGLFQLIKTSRDLDEVDAYAEMGIRAGQRLTSLLGDVLDLARIEAARVSFEKKSFALANIFVDLTETFSPPNFSKSLPLVISAAANLPSEVIGDMVRVRQILFNLVGNAMKYTDQGEVRVEVSTLLPHPSGMARLLFIVSDTGLGIPDEKIDQICIPFTQVSEDFTRSRQGAGLGLAIVQKLVAAMGGTLTFDSTSGEGTSVYLVLPFEVPEHSTIPKLPTPRPSSERLASLQLLLVEDDEICRISGKSLLEKMGHQVVTANNGEEALEALRVGSFDCVLMDIQMDILDGVETTRRIRSGNYGLLDTHIPIIAMTAFAMAGDREKFLEAGMNDYIAKPVYAEELNKALALVTDALSKSRVK